MFDIHQPLDEDGDYDEQAVEEYIEGLVEEFAASPEAKPVVEQYGNLGWAGSMMDYAIGHIGVTPPKMFGSDFEEVLFELIPRKVSTGPDSAAAIVAELRAFWTFLQRAYNLRNAASILKILKEGAVERLERELSNPANYGMAKSFFMKGQELGFDMTTQEGLDAFMLFYNSQLAGARGIPPFAGGTFPGPLESSFGDFPEGSLIFPPSPSPKDRAEMRRKKHKAERQARKRSRRKK
jgi:hypothetical protein